MSASEKFLFETTFDKPERGGNAKPLPTHTEEEVEAAKEQAFLAGQEAAIAAIEERGIKELFSKIGVRIEDLTATRVTDTDQIARQTTEVAVVICRKVLPEMARRNALSEIESLVRDCIEAMPEEPRIVVRVADQMVDALQARTAEFSGGFDGKLVLLGDDQMPVTDCAVVWADGGTARNLERVWQDIDSAIDRLLASVPAADATPDTEESEPAAATVPTAEAGPNNDDETARVSEHPEESAAAAAAST